MKIEIDKEMFFLTSWPYGRLRKVKILGFHDNNPEKIYIRYLDTGGSDTTIEDFLFEYPVLEALK